MAPTVVLFLLPATLLMEENVVGIMLALARDDIRIIRYLLFNSALAYCVNLTNFLFTKHTSALTLQFFDIFFLFFSIFLYFCALLQKGAPYAFKTLIHYLANIVQISLSIPEPVAQNLLTLL
uniref:Uncharacterized protein n=1 Tax=Nelumbo nucifera TaxID=4432 RepID=A0A822ZME0_NELNU|nr:TPA_asm: hypothetical protein HUJ06_004163 [Nelumbo nucifera]